MRLLLTKAARSLAALSHDVLFVLLNNWEGKEADTLNFGDQSGACSRMKKAPPLCGRDQMPIVSQ